MFEGIERYNNGGNRVIIEAIFEVTRASGEEHNEGADDKEEEVEEGGNPDGEEEWFTTLPL